VFLPRQVEAGSSSSIFGLLSIFFVDLIVNWSLYYKPKQELVKWTVATVFSFLLGMLPYVDNFAHLGGSLAGLFAGLIVMPTVISVKKAMLVRVLSVIGLIVFFVVGFVLFYYKVDMDHYCVPCEYLSCIPIWGLCDQALQHQ